MRYKQIYKPLQMAICATLICASFTACSNSETDILSTEESKVPLTISATIQSGTEARKADYDATTFETGDEIGLYILSTADHESAYSSDYTCYNVRATYNGSSWTLDNNIYLSSDNAHVIAYYPYDESFGTSSLPEYTNGLTYDLALTDNEQTDVLASDGVTVSSDSPQAQLVFNHVLSRVVLSIGLSDDIESASLTSAAISSQVYSTTCLYLFEGLFYTYYSGATEDYLTLSLDETLSATERTNVDFLIPSTSSTTITTQLIIDGTTYSVDLTTDKWTAGCQYTYLINVKKTEDEADILLEVDTSSTIISGWTDGGTSDEIELGATSDEEDSDDEDTGDSDSNSYEAVDLGLSVKWATMNVGAESPEDYGGYYAWGETETKDKYSTSNSTTYGVEISFDISGNAEYDAATANWGGSWRTPTLEEIEELISCTDEYTTLNGVTGYLVTGSNGNSIFLPAGGYYNSGTLYYEGERACYWSSTPCESGSTYTYETSAYWLGSHFNDYSILTYGWTSGRWCGYSIRPVTE